MPLPILVEFEDVMKFVRVSEFRDCDFDEDAVDDDCCDDVW